MPICGHATLASAKVILSRYPTLEQATFDTRFWGQLVVKRSAAPDENSLDIIISLSTLPNETLKTIGEQAYSLTAEKGPGFAKALGIQTDQVVSVGEFEFVDTSYIVEVAPDVDLESLKVDPKDLVSWIYDQNQCADGWVMLAVTDLVQVPYSPDMTIVTQMKPDQSSSGVLRTHTRVFCEYMEDPVVRSLCRLQYQD